MRIAVSGGGTVGHVSPVLATVGALREHNPAVECLYLGQASGVEAELARVAGLRFAAVQGGKFRRLPGAGVWTNLWRSDTWLNLRDLLLITIGTVQSIMVLHRFKPQAVFNKSGPTGLPVGLACRLLRIPMMIHEPDVTPGLNNRILSRWAAVVATGFPTEHYRQRFPMAKVQYTGTPVQAEILHASTKPAIRQFKLDSKRPVVVVVGGSLGAAAINQAVAEILPQLTKYSQVVHITGRAGFAAAQKAARHHKIMASEGYHPVSFVTAGLLGSLYHTATLVVSRGGASSIAELAALAKPVIMLPNHQAAAHQIANAAVLEKAQAVELLPQEASRPLLTAITSLLNDLHRRDALAQNLSVFYIADAPQRLARLLASIATSGEGRR